MDIPLLSEKPAFALVLSAGWLAPGLIALGLYDPGLLLTLDLARLIVFALVIPAPCIASLVFGFLISIDRRNREQHGYTKPNIEVAEATAGGLLVHTVIFYLVAFAAWLTDGYRTAFACAWVGCSLAGAIAAASAGRSKKARH